ncbi:MAG: UTP--glucose-1-phosphate uridylyltransferase [Planctomycetota bacterium]|jgi:UTP--glucose-1-phosphate uridylyltransferase|nr:UTP--glucose-1-phosphate uridylyltransferase [Planctomycetota bacterium]
MSIDKVVIPVAGMGTRLLPATKSQPKEMLPIARKPVVQYVVEEMVDQGLKDILFITGKDKRSIEDHFDRDPELTQRLAEAEDIEHMEEIDYESEGVRFFYTRQMIATGSRLPSGLGDAIASAEQFVGVEPFVVGLGDTIIQSSNYSGLVRRMIQSHLRYGASATIAVCDVAEDEVQHYGVVKPKGRAKTDFEIEDIIEKPSVAEAPSKLAVAARYVFNSEIFAAIKRTPPGIGGELHLTDAIRNLMKMGHKVRCIRLKRDERRYDIGSPESYFKAFIDFALSDQKHGYLIRQYIEKRLREI